MCVITLTLNDEKNDYSKFERRSVEHRDILDLDQEFLRDVEDSDEFPDGWYSVSIGSRGYYEGYDEIKLGSDDLTINGDDYITVWEDEDYKDEEGYEARFDCYNYSEFQHISATKYGLEICTSEEEHQEVFYFGLNNLTEKELIPILKQYGFLIKFIKNQTDQMQITAIQSNYENYQYVTNPSLDVKAFAVNQRLQA